MHLAHNSSIPAVDIAPPSGRVRVRRFLEGARGFTVAALALVLAAVLAPGAAAGPTYVVDRGNLSCSDAGPGSAAHPFCTIGAAVKKGGPGVTVEVRPGVYPERITVPVSGAPDDPFVIRGVALPGQPVVIEGADDFSDPAAWQPAGGDRWLAAAVAVAPKQVFVDGARLAFWAGATDSLPPLSFAYEAGVGLFVHSPGVHPGARRVQVGVRTNGFRLNARAWVTIEGFTVLRTEDKGIYVLGGSTEITLRDNAVGWCRSNGIGVYGCSAVRIEANRVGDNGDHGISLGQGTTLAVVIGNESHRNARPTTRAATGIYLFGAPNNRIEGNRVHDNQDSGIEMSTDADGTVLIQNLSWSNGDHGYDHVYVTGTVHVGNVAWGNYKDGFSIEGLSTGTRLTNCIAAMNGLLTARYDYYVEPGSEAGMVSDYNVIWASNGRNPIKFAGIRCANVAALAAATGHDAHSHSSDPRFVDPANGDFHLSPGSPAIDAGLSGGDHWPARDAEGRQRVDVPAAPNVGDGAITFADRGAFEHHPEGDRPPTIDAPATLVVREGEAIDLLVSASDPDGEPVRRLAADLGTLPPATASYTPLADRWTGRLLWTPSFEEAGVYPVLFTATSSATATVGMTITVQNVDRAPVLGAPPQVNAITEVPLHLRVTALDPDGAAIASITADLAEFPAGSNARFVADAGNGSGTLSWTPRIADKNGIVNVRFAATNALATTAVTAIRVSAPQGSGSGGRVNGVAEPACTGPAPNPARGAVSFALDLPESDQVRWSIHDVQGRSLASEARAFGAGRHALRWAPAASAGRVPAAGVFFLRLTTASGLDVTRRFLLLP